MKKILIVDDDEDLLFILNEFLSAKGYRPLTLADGSFAIAATKNMHPDLILMDVNIKNMDGREICQKLKHDPETSGIPIMMISSDRKKKDVMGVCEADDFMEKPFNMSSLYAKVEALIT